MSKQNCMQELPNEHKPLDFPEVNGIINDAEWSCNVALMVESEASHVVFTQMFQVATKTEQGPFINITQASIIKDLKKFKAPTKEKSGSPISKKGVKTPPSEKGVKTPPKEKGVKTPPTEKEVKTPPSAKGVKTPSSGTTGTPDNKSELENPSFGIEQICKKILKTKNAVIPPAFMALLIKSKIMNLREEYLKTLYAVKEEDKSKAQNKNKSNMKSKSDQKSNKSEKVEKVKSGNISKKRKESEKNKNEPNISSKDVGVEGKVTNKITVSPFAGPNLYIVFSGFYDGLLPFEMIRVGIPLNVVIRMIHDIQEPQPKLTSTHSVKSILQEENEADENRSMGKISLTTKRSSKTAGGKHGKKKSGMDIHLQDNINNFWTDFNNNINSFENVELTSGLLTNTMMLPFEPDLVDPKDIEIRKEVYEIVSLKMYHIQNIIGEQAQYIRHMKMYQFGETIILPENMYIYESMVQLVPLECTHIEYILYCIIEQVSVLLAKCEASDLAEVQPKIESQLNSECNDQTTSTSVDVPDITPAILKYGDTIGKNTFHINMPKLALSKITTEVLSGMPIVCLWELYPDHHKDLVKDKLEFQLQKLLNNWTGPPISRNLFLIYLHQFIFHQMQSFHKVLKWPDKIMSEEEQEYQVCSNSDVGSFTNPDIAENKSEHKHQTLAEKKIIRQQQLVGLNMFLECSEIKSLIENFKFTLSPDFTVPVEADMNYYHFIEEMDRHNLFQAFHESLFAFNTVEYTYYPLTDKMLLWFYNNKNDDGLNDVRVTASLLTPVGLRDFVKFIYTEQASYSSHNEAIKVQDGTEVIDLIKLPSLHNAEDGQPLLHTGYDLGHSRIQVTEKCKTFYLNKKTTITIKINDWLYGSKLLSLYISELGNVLTYHKYLRRDDHSTLHNSHDFRVQFETSNGIIFNFLKSGKKLNLEQNVARQDTINLYDKVKKSSDNNAYKEVNKKSKTSIGSAPTSTPVLAEASKQTPVCDINICFPNGLLIEVVRDDRTGDIFYIRQRNTVKCFSTNELIMQEEYRCYLRNGTILVFYTDGRVEILYNNTTKVICNGFQLPDPPPPPPPTSAFSIDTSINISTQGLKSQSRAINILKGKKASSKMSIVSHTSVSRPHTSNAKEEKRVKKVSTKKSIGSQKSVTKEFRKSFRGSQRSKSLIAVERIEKTSNEVPPPDVDPKLLNILEHNVITWSGENLKFISGKITEREKQFTLRSAMDIANQELYTTRGDRSTTLLNSDSLLCTGFGDGTRITNALILEPRRVTVTSMAEKEPKLEMTDENIFQSVPDFRFMETDIDSKSEDHILEENKFSGTSRLGSRDTIMETLIDSKSVATIRAEHKFSETSRLGSKASSLPDMAESEFVSILQSVCMEHPSYATVEYMPQSNAIKLSLPGNIVVLVLSDGTYEIEIGEKTMVCVSENGFEFSRSNEKMVKQSKSTVYWSALDSSLESNILSQTVDCFNNIFTVYCNGETEKTMINGKDKILSNCPSEISLNEPHNDRFFIFNRDLSGFEMLQTGSVLSHLQDISKHNNFFKIENKNENGRTALQLLTTQEPLFMNRSEEFRMQYKLPCIQPTFMRRNDLNLPWCNSLSPWLFDSKAKKTKVRSCQLKSDSTYSLRTNTSIIPHLEVSNKYEKPYKAIVIRILKQTAEIHFDALTEIAKTLKTYDYANKVLYKKYTEQTMQDIQSEEEVAAQYDVLSELLNAMNITADQQPNSSLGWEAFKFQCLPDKGE